jgi:hypothetical protein
MVIKLKIKKRKCPNCGELFEIVETNNTQIFCTKKCYFTYWRKSNRDHFNDLVREKSRLHMSKTYKERKKKGMCIYCGDNPAKGKKSCQRCIDRNKKYYEKRQAKLLELKRKRKRKKYYEKRQAKLLELKLEIKNGKGKGK